MDTFLKFVNGTPPSIKSKFIDELLIHHSGYFIEDTSDSGNLCATEFLAVSLFNDASNLVALNTPENTSKSKKPFGVWVHTLPQLEAALIQSIAKNPQNEFAALLDQGEFIVKFKCDNSVNAAYQWCRYGRWSVFANTR